MARARGIKPGFFHDADIVELPFEARLLFIGLWTIADRAGRLEDRPKQIKMDVFPADDVDVNALLNLIVVSGMLQRYTVDGKRYLHIPSFCKHQNPHRDERDSIIPAPQETTTTETTPTEPDKNRDSLYEHDASTVQAPCKHCASMVQIGLTPDSGLLTAISPTPTSKVEEFGNAVGQALPDASSKPGIDQPEDPKPPSTKKTRLRSRLPDDFFPDDAGVSKAQAKGLSVLNERIRFSDFHTAKGSLMADWQAAWRTWIGNAKPQLSAVKGPAEPAWRTEQRNRTLQAVPGIAQRPAEGQNFIDVESQNVTAIALG